MAKRKLNRRQKWRIEKIQEEKKARALKKAAKVEAELIDDSQFEGEEIGLVISHFGQQLLIESDQDKARFRCHARANVPVLVTGDRIIFHRHKHGEAGIIVARLDRQNTLKRPDNFGHLKPVAANIDQILIVFSPIPIPSAALLDRYLCACEATGIPAKFILNKSDLLEEYPEVLTLAQQYESLGYPFIQTSIKQNDFAELEALVHQKTSVFVGQSGVGKSTLVNHLLPDANQAVNIISDNSLLGQHTTTTATLFHLPRGGQLIDSPGIRDFQLWHLEVDTLMDTFIEFKPFAGHCRFRDCRHEAEPGCAFKSAVEEGKISQARWQSYQTIRAALEQSDFDPSQFDQ